jgi:hypothetical protein
MSAYSDHGCRVYWGHCGCDLYRGHDGNHVGIHVDDGDQITVHAIRPDYPHLFGEDAPEAATLAEESTQ